MGKDLKGKELGEGIRQNKNGRYEARFVDRFGKRISLYATSKVEIKKKLKEAIEQDRMHTSVRKKFTLDEWYDRWMNIYKIGVIRLNTKRHYEYVFKNNISPYLGLKFIHEIKPIDVKNVINEADKRGLGWESQNKIRILLVDMFDCAMENDYVIKNPARGVKLAKCKPKDERIVLSVEEQKEFFNCSSGTFYDNLFVVAVQTGLRPGELFALTKDDIDLEKKMISVTKTLLYQKLEGDDKKEFHIDQPKTRSSERVVPINTACEKALIAQFRLKRIVEKRYPKDSEFKDLLFVTKLNTPLNSVLYCAAIEKIINEINLLRDELDKFPKFSGHSFRHTFATRCLEAGVAPKTIQKLLGHASLQMTMDLYVHINDKFKESEIRKLEIAYPMEREEIGVFSSISSKNGGVLQGYTA